MYIAAVKYCILHRVDRHSLYDLQCPWRQIRAWLWGLFPIFQLHVFTFVTLQVTQPVASLMQATSSFAWPLTSSCICLSVFQEFKNVDGEEYHADMSTLASPASQGSPDVYILPLTEVSLPVAKQPSRSGESKGAATKKHVLKNHTGIFEVKTECTRG